MMLVVVLLRHQAGKYYAKCGDYHKSLNLFLQCGDKMLDEAIRVRVS